MMMVSKRTSAARRREALERVLEITTRLGEGMEADAAGRGLTIARAEVVWIVHHSGPMRQRDLADALRVTPRNVTGLLDALEKTGFVTRTPHPSDRRATLVELTLKGKAAASALASDQEEFAAYLFAGFGADDLSQLVTTSDKLLKRLRDRAYADIRQDALDRWSKQRPPPDDQTPR